MDLNSITLSGTLVRDPELRSTKGDKAVVSLRLASNGFKDETTFIDAVAWDKAAEIIAQYTSQGTRLTVIGRLQQEEWETKEGQKRTSYKVNIRDFLLPPKVETGADDEPEF